MIENCFTSESQHNKWGTNGMMLKDKRKSFFRFCDSLLSVLAVAAD